MEFTASLIPWYQMVGGTRSPEHPLEGILIACRNVEPSGLVHNVVLGLRVDDNEPAAIAALKDKAWRVIQAGGLNASVRESFNVEITDPTKIGEPAPNPNVRGNPLTQDYSLGGAQIVQLLTAVSRHAQVQALPAALDEGYQEPPRRA